MTPEERERAQDALRIAGKVDLTSMTVGNITVDLVEQVATAISEAVAEETERCAKIVEGYSLWSGGGGDEDCLTGEVAAAIRAPREGE